METNNNSPGEVQGNLADIVREQEVLRGQVSALGEDENKNKRVLITRYIRKLGEVESKTVEETVEVILRGVTKEGLCVEEYEGDYKGVSHFEEYIGGATWPQIIKKITTVGPEKRDLYDVTLAPNVLCEMLKHFMGKDKFELTCSKFAQEGREILFGGVSENPQESYIQTESVKYKPDRDISEYLSIESDLIKEELFDEWTRIVKENYENDYTRKSLETTYMVLREIGKLKESEDLRSLIEKVIMDGDLSWGQILPLGRYVAFFSPYEEAKSSERICESIVRKMI